MQAQLCSDPWGSRGSQEGRMGPTARAPRLLGQIISFSVAVSSFASSLIANLGTYSIFSIPLIGLIQTNKIINDST